MKTINKEALRAQLLAAGMAEEQINATLTASEQDTEPTSDPKVLAELDEIKTALAKGIKKGDLKIEHEDDDDGEEYEIEAEDDDEAEAEMDARAAARGMSKAIQVGNYEGLLSALLKSNAKLVKSLRQERKIFLAKVEKALQGAGSEEIASLKTALEAQGNTLAEIKKGLMVPEAPRGRTGAAPVHHPAEQPAKTTESAWDHTKLKKAIMANMGRWNSDKRDQALNAINMARVDASISAASIAAELDLKLSDIQ